MSVAPARVAQIVSPRALIWLFHLSLPIAGLWLLLGNPAYDVVWQDQFAHFWLILAVALVNVGLAIVIGRAADARQDVRLFLIALAFGSAAGFFALHALATPTVLLGAASLAFTLSTPTGIVIAGLFGLVSAVEPSKALRSRILEARRPLALAVTGLLMVWGGISLVPGSPLSRPTPEAASQTLVQVIGIGGAVIELAIAGLYLRLYRRRPAVVLISIVTAFALLAEALIAVTFSHAWHASWWEWHLLLLLAFGFVAYSAHVQYRREGRATSLFQSLATDDTLRRLQDEYATALERLVAAIEEASETGAQTNLAPIAARLTDRFGLTEGQADVLVRAAEALAAERREVRKLGMFRRYLSPEVASALLADPSQAGLGGDTVEVTVLFADLRGFTSFAESADPAVVVGLLNEYFGAVVPIILGEGGTVVQFVGDAIMAIFNAPVRQADHALRAARAALAFQARITALADEAGADRPRFRVGIATGSAVVGNVGSEEVRSFTAIGETVNLAARLQAQAEVGHVVISPTTAERLEGRATLRPLGGLDLKGISTSVDAFELLAV